MESNATTSTPFISNCATRLGSLHRSTAFESMVFIGGSPIMSRRCALVSVGKRWTRQMQLKPPANRFGPVEPRAVTRVVPAGRARGFYAGLCPRIEYQFAEGAPGWTEHRISREYGRGVTSHHPVRRAGGSFYSIFAIICHRR